MPKPNYPLREKRKRETRRTLIRAADELFSRQGYRETTLEEVAARAGVHVQTLYRHFPTKESLVLAGERNALERVSAELSDPGRAEDTITVWRHHIGRYSISADPSQVRAGFLKRQETTRAMPELSGSMQRMSLEYEDLLTAALASDLGLDPARDRRPRLIALMLQGGNRQAYREWVTSEVTTDYAEHMLSVVDDVVRFMEDAGISITTP